MDPSQILPDYTYKPLGSNQGQDSDKIANEIRLVHLFPPETGSFAEPIRLRLVHVPFPLPEEPGPRPSQTPKRQRKWNAEYLEALEREITMPWNLEETTAGELIAFNVVTGETHLLDQEDFLDEEKLCLEEKSTQLLMPSYEALSYTWGEAAISEYAVVEVGIGGGRRAERRLGIRRNLACALRHLRLPHSQGPGSNSTQVVWIDAICINQDDVDERNRQVKRMTDIYTLAERVVGWLGDEGDDSSHAIEILSHVGNQIRSTLSGRIIAGPGATEPRLWRNDTPPSFTERDWRAVMAFVERAWFYRIWCWQEIKLGSSSAVLQCGRDAMPWGAFRLAIVCLHNKDTTRSRHFRERCRHIAFLQSEGESLSNLLDTAKSKGCADPRDKIFGLLGITPSYFRAGVTVDYHRSPEHVYREAFMAHLSATLRLDLLKHCDLSTRKIGGPTWVPDWSRTDFAAPIFSEQLSAGHSRAWFTYRPEDARTLGVLGTQFATINSVSTRTASTIEEETLFYVKEWYEQFSQEIAHPYHGSGEDGKTAFALSLCMNRTRERQPDNHMLSAYEWVSLLNRILQLDPEWPDPEIFLQREIANTIQKLRGRRFVVTDSGHFGTAPGSTQVGDIVSILLGTYSPIILRPTPQINPDNTNSTITFRVVGECYIHGLSDGVGLLGPAPYAWRPILMGDMMGRARQWFLNLTTGDRTVEDPRLDVSTPLPYHGWHRAVYERTDQDPVMFERFVHVETDEMQNHDPRMAPEELETMGAQLRTFLLV